ncbi:MAG: hypothetical protein JNG85_10970, partial [Spirochaetaceae bacterium]|nr:hypothetical protein [Spirochaetaceae bacterium]
MNDIATTALKPQHYFSKFLYLDGGFVLLAPETPVTNELVNRLARWEFRDLKTEGEEVASPAVEATAGAAPEAADAAPMPKIANDAADDERLASILAFYEKFTEYVEGFYHQFVTQNQLN